MVVKETYIKGLYQITPKVFGDERGYFFESFRNSIKEEILTPNTDFVQENQSFSEKGVLRGLHFQKGSYSQGKLVKVAMGKVLDVVVDLRLESDTYGQWYSEVLDDKRHNMLYVPEGFAHGFYTIEDAVFQYKCTNYYHRESESGLIWNDKDLAIDWSLSGKPLVSEKDILLPTFSEIKTLKIEWK